MAFQWMEALPGVLHIQDAMGVCMTLIKGENQALLVDAGYGLEDVQSFAETLTDKPVRLALTHGHHDHALGARWFPAAWMLEAEFPVFETYAGEKWRRHVLSGARDKGVPVDEQAFLSEPMPKPQALEAGEIDLGGLTARFIPCPGHTLGSMTVYVPERKLLLTGDDWNPCTWLFFPEALCAQDYRRNVKRLLELPFEHVLCSHQFALFGRDRLDRFLENLTDERLENAREVDTGASVGARTAEARLPMDQVFIFDKDKFERRKAGENKSDD